MNINHMRHQFAVGSASLVVLSGVIAFNPQPVEARGTKIITKTVREWVKKCNVGCWMQLVDMAYDFAVPDEQESEEPKFQSGKGSTTRTGGEAQLIRKRVVRVIKRVPVSR